jgi:hypothetical protein
MLKGLRSGERLTLAALGVLCLAACGGGTAGGGASPRPSLSVPARPEQSAAAPTAPAETAPPATRPPATQPPATQPPATQPPATQPPATQPPATQPPATAPPATRPPATAAPATAVPATALPVTAAPATTSTASISPWWWLLVAAIVVALVVGGVLLWRRRSARQDWTEELGRVVTELRWANDQLIPGMFAARTAREFAQSWKDGRPRLVAADQELYGLAQRAPDETGAASIARLRSATAGLMSAVDGEAGLTSEDPEALRAARADVERARSEFSAALDAAEGKPQPAAPEPTAAPR